MTFQNEKANILIKYYNMIVVCHEKMSKWFVHSGKNKKIHCKHPINNFVSFR